MEEIVESEVGNEEKRVEDHVCLPSPRPVADTVVYKLVRVEGDGTLIPATDDEVIEVADLLEEDKVEQPLLVESGQTERCIVSNALSNGGIAHEGSKGLPQFESLDSGLKKRNARLEYIEDMLQKVKEEERLQLLHGVSRHSSQYTSIVQSSNQHEQLPVGDADNPSDSCVMKALPSLTVTSTEDIKRHSLKSEECTKQSAETVMNGEHVSDASCGTKLDVLTTEGEICLDNLSIRKLQQTFRATFGWDTSVKDKLWLKRRIAIGLMNSSNVPATGFIIKDKSLIFGGGSNENVNDQNMDGTLPRDEIIVRGGTSSRVAVTVDSISEVELAGSRKKSRMTQTENDIMEASEMEQRAAKRVRKPTKRYIEELSEVGTKGTGGMPTSAIKKSENISSFKNSQSRYAYGTGSADSIAIATRHDSFGGSGVQVPIVSRPRRGRPRKNYVGFLHQNGMAARIVKKALGLRTSRQDSEISSRSWKYRTLSAAQRKRGIEISTSETPVVPYLGGRHQSSEAMKLDSPEDLDEYPVTVATAKGGTRRKHHRAWTLPEVMRLVEGVSRCGAGRWSEIKRFAFASSAYRTSVDLKDKWRNLLKASEQAATDRTLKSSRKHATVPVPAQILVRVRELAAMNSHHHPGTCEISRGRNGKNVHNIPVI